MLALVGRSAVISSGDMIPALVCGNMPSSYAIAQASARYSVVRA